MSESATHKPYSKSAVPEAEGMQAECVVEWQEGQNNGIDVHWLWWRLHAGVMWWNKSGF